MIPKATQGGSGTFTRFSLLLRVKNLCMRVRAGVPYINNT